ncbi:glyoxalase/bleomycin resistance/dioxygenase family protein [Woeseia oceani]|uniref:VOC domain-containing protein n=1 Tax=Woeseia oceani TaxID=1548547 RepID=A0A193LBU7_9GAMM|nr:glyoxalase/bleomycin resistance/dioxygenase family protein [Woeseia oceani]ANO49911.1 hypothetical protein BA177_00580 [Woeseia oceani]
MLERWLEISVHSSDILESLSFYRALGFTELQSGDVWPHPYAVVSDGDLVIGLHEREFASPTLTFVQPELGRHARAMSDHGFEFSLMHLDADVFNELQFMDHDGHNIALLEARTFSQSEDSCKDSACGRFFELTLPTRDAVQAGRFWAPLAPHVERLREEPTTHMRFDAGGLPLGVSESIALDKPAICFKWSDPQTIADLVERFGFRWQKFPGFEGAFGVLVAPEGTRLYLFDEDFLGEPYLVSEEDAAP